MAALATSSIIIASEPSIVNTQFYIYLQIFYLNGYVDRDEKKLEELMQKKAKVALDEGYIFGDEGRGFERINVASPRSVIEECMNRIRTAFEEEKLV